ncbi:MAG: hypothetical protein LC620_00400 [Halobacteriales archaeon]|nr:hypothetical protein [Halobacteriales archaeon]
MSENASPPAQARPWIHRILGTTDLPKPKRNGYNGIILTERGDAEVYPVTHLPIVKREGGGLYKKEGYARYWLRKPIPAGWVTVWLETDPEPVSMREPVGYGPKTLDLLTGSHIVHVVGGGFQGTFKVTRWMVWVIVAGIAVAAAMGIYAWYRSKFHA